MKQLLRVLIIEDSDNDAALLQKTLDHGGYEVSSKVVKTTDALRSALENQEWDLITSDHSMPQFNAQEALNIVNDLRPDLPFIVVCGGMEVNLIVSLMQAGAKDYILKDEVERIVPVINRELSSCELLREKNRLDAKYKKSESRYRRVFEAAQDGILILDISTEKIVDVNSSLITMLNFSKEELIGKKLWETSMFKNGDMAHMICDEIQKKSRNRYENIPLQTKKGSHLAVELFSNVYLVEGEKFAQYNFRDITEHEVSLSKINKINSELERQVQDRISLLELRNQNLESYDYTIAHDLRAPLRHIMGFTKALRDEEENVQSAESLHLIHKILNSIDHMNALIEALLNLTRLFRFELVRETVNLSAMVQNINAELQQNNPDRQVEFETAEGIQASGDRVLLQIALQNLISNAWKFTSNCERAAIEFGTIQKEDVCAYFIRDNGAGFNMTYADKLFNAFGRLHSAAEFPGIGIGLATVKRIISRHRGQIWAESEVDKGATFYFTIG